MQAVGGNTALALLLVIITNLGGIFTMPVRMLITASHAAIIQNAAGHHITCTSL